jgi:anti-sigma-K factor RskA
MKTDTTHTLIGAYVLDAVDDVERAEVERHLAGCEECAAEVTELREAVAQFASSAALEPPPGLRDRVRAGVARTRQLPPGRTGTSPAVRSGRSGRWLRNVAVGVAACLLVGAAGVGVWQVQRRFALERDVAQAAEQRALDAERRELAIREVLAAPDARVRTMKVKSGGQIVVVASLAQDQAVVVLSDLRQMSTDKTYQLWLVEQAKPLSAGVLDTGTTEVTQLVTGLRKAQKICLTVEPAGGSNQPTTTPVVVVNLE